MNLEPCPICFEAYNSNLHQPKILPCGHNICFSCLQGLLNANTFQCPYDRIAFGNQYNSAHNFPNNEIILLLNQGEKQNNQSFCQQHGRNKDYIVYPEGKRICKVCSNYEFLKNCQVKALKTIQAEKKKKQEELQKKIKEFDMRKNNLNQTLQTAYKSMQEESNKKFQLAQQNLKRQEMEEWAQFGLLFKAKKLKTDSELSSDKSLREALQTKVFDLEDTENFDYNILKEEEETQASFQISSQEKKVCSEIQALQQVYSAQHSNLNNVLASFQELSKAFFTMEQFNTNQTTLFTQNLQAIKQLIQIERYGDRIVIKPREWSHDNYLPTDILEQVDLWKNYKNVTISFFKDRVTEESLQAIFAVWSELPQANNLKLSLSNPRLTDEEILFLFNRDFWANSNMKVIEIDFQKCTFSDAALNQIARKITSHMPNLEYLQFHFSETKISDKTLKTLGKHAISSLTNLKTFGLGLYACPNITSNGLISLVPFIKNPLKNIQNINFHIGGNKLSNTAITYLSQEVFAGFQNLQEFHISLNASELNDNGLEQICQDIKEAVRNAKKFTLLLNNTYITDNGIEKMSQMLVPSFSQVKEFFFSLYRTRITDKSFRVLFDAMKNYMPNLESLLYNFGSTRISDASINQYANENLEKMKSIKSLKLYLHETPVTDHSIVNFGGKVRSVLSNIENLCLGLNSTEVTNHSAETMKQVLENAMTLQGFHVHLGNTRVSTNKIQEISTIQKQRGVRILI